MNKIQLAFKRKKTGKITWQKVVFTGYTCLFNL